MVRASVQKEDTFRLLSLLPWLSMGTVKLRGGGTKTRASCRRYSSLRGGGGGTAILATHPPPSPAVTPISTMLLLQTHTQGEDDIVDTLVYIFLQ